MSLHATLSSVVWCALSLGFVAVSCWAARVFWAGVRAAERIPDRGDRRALALDVAWDYLGGELWRLAQHVASLAIGVASFFVTPVPPHEVPPDAAAFGAFLVLALFFINVASGINSVRAVKGWRRRQAIIRGRARASARRRAAKSAAPGDPAQERNRP